MCKYSPPLESPNPLNPKAQPYTPPKVEKMANTDEEASRHHLQLLNLNEAQKKPPLVLPHMLYNPHPQLAQHASLSLPPLTPPQPVVCQPTVPQVLYYQALGNYICPPYHYYSNNIYYEYQVCTPAYTPLVQYHPPLACPLKGDNGGRVVVGGGEGEVEGAENNVGFVGRTYFGKEQKGFKRSMAPRMNRRQGQNFSCWSKNSCRQWRPRMSTTDSVDDAVKSGSHSYSSPPPYVRKTASDGGGVAAACDDGDVASGKTTLMIKNVPNQFRRATFLTFMDNFCYQENEKAKLHGDEIQCEYDFLYLPMDFVRKDNYGYAFVNFTSASAALRVKELLHNFKWGLVPSSKGFVESRKTCEIAWARLQGKDELVEHFKDSNFSCFRDDYLPVIFTPPRNGSISTTEAKNIGKCRVKPRRHRSV